MFSPIIYLSLSLSLIFSYFHEDNPNAPNIWFLSKLFLKQQLGSTVQAEDTFLVLK